MLLRLFKSMIEHVFKTLGSLISLSYLLLLALLNGRVQSIDLARELKDPIS